MYLQSFGYLPQTHLPFGAMRVNTYQLTMDRVLSTKQVTKSMLLNTDADSIVLPA